MNVTETVETISADFENSTGPFADVTFPEARLLDETEPRNMENKLFVVSMFSTFDYNRNANQLVDNLVELWNSENRFLFYPVGGRADLSEISDIFSEIGFRYPNRDAKAWKKNCRILREKYGGSWRNLLLDVKCDAPTLVERLNEDGFSCLKGDKIAPMYARIINDSVTPMSNVWDLEIPVDTHIRRLSRDLFDAPDMDDDTIRREWRGLSVEADIERHVVDGGLWHIGNKWDDWGEEYWNSL